jgi:acyl-CoA thioesterase-2
MSTGLASLLDVTPIETNVFIGQSEDLGFRNLFGGQVLGQSLVAAGRTVAPDRPAHSLHGYFLRAGDPREAVYYEVDLIRSGNSFSTRRVVAKQKGLAIFSMSASFQSPESGFDHQTSMPNVPGPEGIKSDLEHARSAKDELPEPLRSKFTADRAIEIRTIEQSFYGNVSKGLPIRHSWMRMVDPVPDDPLLHQALMAYASDFGISMTALLPHGVSFLDHRLMLASLDHSMWFHRPTRCDDWHLYVKESPAAVSARGLNRGQIFSQDGKIVASVAQEGLMRLKAERPPSS